MEKAYFDQHLGLCSNQTLVKTYTNCALHSSNCETYFGRSDVQKPGQVLNMHSNCLFWIGVIFILQFMWQIKAAKFLLHNLKAESHIFIWQLFVHGHPVTILVTALTTPDNLTNDLSFSTHWKPINISHSKWCNKTRNMKNINLVSFVHYLNLKCTWGVK